MKCYFQRHSSKIYYLKTNVVSKTTIDTLIQPTVKITSWYTFSCLYTVLNLLPINYNFLLFTDWTISVNQKMSFLLHYLILPFFLLQTLWMARCPIAQFLTRHMSLFFVYLVPQIMEHFLTSRLYLKHQQINITRTLMCDIQQMYLK